MQMTRPKQFHKEDKDLAEISAYFEGEPIVIEVIPVIGKDWNYEFLAWCSLPCDDVVFHLEGRSNSLKQAVANLHAKMKEHEKRNK